MDKTYHSFYDAIVYNYVGTFPILRAPSRGGYFLSCTILDVTIIIELKDS